MDNSKYVKFTELFLKSIYIFIPIIALLWVLEVPFYLGVDLWDLQVYILVVGFMLGGSFLRNSITRKEQFERIPIYDFLFALIIIGIGLYLFFYYPQLAYQLPNPVKIIISLIVVLFTLEAVRRQYGWVLVLLPTSFVLYAAFAANFPAPFQGKSVPWDSLITYLGLDVNALLGTPFKVVVTMAFAFIMFGVALEKTGGTKFYTDMAMSLVSRSTAGAAKVAVVASGFFGSISGSAVSNVATTGAVTIPMMKKSGFSPEFAAATEAVASTGGQFVPPVMGATVFVMAGFLGIPYREVVIAAIVPAILYYVLVFVQVHMEGLKKGIEGAETTLKTIEVLRGGWQFLIPLVYLIYALLIANTRPEKAAIISIVLLLILSKITRTSKVNFEMLLNIIIDTGKILVPLGSVVLAAGLIIGTLNISGLAIRLSSILVNIAGGNTLLLLLIAAIASMILGMGMPTVAVYVLLAVIIAPALVNLGIVPIAAHLFIFYFGMMAMITPPVCLAVFVAASMADSHPMKTGFLAMKLGAVAYLVPFLMVFSPELILQGDIANVIVTIINAFVGTIVFAISLAGYLFGKLNWLKRIIFFIGSIILLVPLDLTWVNLVIQGIALISIIMLALWERQGKRSRNISLQIN